MDAPPKKRVKVKQRSGDRLQYWMLQLPSSISKTWEQLYNRKEPLDEPVGYLEVDNSKGGDPQVKLVLSQALHPGRVSELDIQLQQRKANASSSSKTASSSSSSSSVRDVYALSESDNCKVLGAVKVQAHARPVTTTKDYARSLKRANWSKKRTEKTTMLISAEQAKSQVKKNREEVIMNDVSDNKGALISEKGTVIKEKRFSRPKEEVATMLFELFSKSAVNTFKEIQIATNQPTEYLKTILPEYCEQVKHSANIRKYTLRDEFKLATDSSEVT